jgi:hypothetical protein
LDASWDDQTVPGLDLDDPLNEFDRVTAVPDLPPELYAKRVMASVEDSRPPELPTTPPVRARQPFASAQFTLDTAPPGGSQSADSTAPRSALAQNAQNAPTARPSANVRQRHAGTALPTPSNAVGAPRLPLPPGSTGLELAAERTQRGSLEPASNPRPSMADSRQPALELEFDGLLTGPISTAQTPPDNPALTALKDRYVMGDFTGALLIAEGIMASNPSDPDAPRYAQSCRDVLTQMYSARLGSLDQVVRVALPSDQIRWLTLDHRAGFLLSLIDGGSTVDQILDISGMTRLDALRIMYQLLDQRVISLGS